MPNLPSPDEIEAATLAYITLCTLLDPVRLRLWDVANLTLTQLRLLMHLHNDEGISNAELAIRLEVTRPSVSALLERLERAGFIRREVARQDRRAISVYLEPRGREVVTHVNTELRDYCARLVGGLNPHEIKTLTTVANHLSTVGRGA